MIAGSRWPAWTATWLSWRRRDRSARSRSELTGPCLPPPAGVRRSGLTRATVAIVLVMGILAVVIAADFTRRLETSVSAGGDLPRNAVVFTGQYARIHTGLDLLRAGRIERLFISGVNPGAGIQIDRFADQFNLDGALRRSLSTDRLTLGPAAKTTWGNGLETRCWMRRRGGTSPVLLITSRTHMPRASLTLELMIPSRPVQRLSVGQLNDQSATRIAVEAAKFAIITLTGFVLPLANRISQHVGLGLPRTATKGPCRHD